MVFCWSKFCSRQNYLKQKPQKTTNSLTPATPFKYMIKSIDTFATPNNARKRQNNYLFTPKSHPMRKSKNSFVSVSLNSTHQQDPLLHPEALPPTQPSFSTDCTQCQTEVVFFALFY